VESKVSCELVGSRENRSLKLCKEFDKLNLRIVANLEVMEMEIDFTLP
jgi:hypothetical protein